MEPLRWIANRVEAQRGHLFAWVPVALAVGIGTYFALPWEPGLPVYAGCAALVGGLGWLAARLGPRLSPFLLVPALVLAGLCLAGLRAHLVAGPVLDFRYYGAVEGRIVEIDRSASDAPRLTLDRVVLERTAPHRTPARVRVSLHGAQGYIVPVPGLRVMTTAHLAPPSGPTEPGGFDFRRMAWFDRLGAVGYTRTPVLAVAPAAEGIAGVRLHRLRMAISTAVQAALPGEAGAFAAAITTGDRSGMGRGTLEALRASNLAHLLAISGLHMGLLAGFVFAALRFGMAAVPKLSLTWPIKKIAAFFALCAAFFYYLLSGGNVATERAMIMIAVMLIAVMLDRRAITLRAVAIAAILVLSFRPETLTEPGFQMSFAATTALVAVFGALRDREGWTVPRWARPILAVVVSSAVAGAATAPVAAAHFNRIADYGLIANLAAVPLMGTIVMPAAVLAALLWPAGLSHLALAIMRPAIEWILGVAHWVSGLDGAITPVVAPGPWVLPILGLGLLWLILWQGRGRLAGLAPAALAIALWAQAKRPPVLVSDTGGLVGLMTETGRALSKPRGEGFVALSWLENDGDAADQAGAFARPGLAAGRFDLDGRSVVHITGRGATERVAESCRTASLVITSVEAGADTGAAGPCILVDEAKLRETGSLAVFPEADRLRFVGAKTGARRLWSQ
ncbi:ComEC/Rec2 family competence protein [Psychromarinibacter sp. C21-152]|uniref:ComEC/Rec2 family competence protein n=1 Tax=Psychromarinibacter sediminicola TaxID=3033385 RepID=A0AAE3NP37_9RHOB|nr:ComEC/Rec2 family competence protein [Psychromarinibacter sediminicola]MDF0599476.1 ComEC/Rec2 family competence protein [Psychromarinibacter sediminicola]